MSARPFAGREKPAVPDAPLMAGKSVLVTGANGLSAGSRRWPEPEGCSNDDLGTTPARQLSTPARAHGIRAFRRLLALGVDRDWRRRRALRDDRRAAFRLGPGRTGRSGRLDRPGPSATGESQPPWPSPARPSDSVTLRAMPCAPP